MFVAISLLFEALVLFWNTSLSGFYSLHSLLLLLSPFPSSVVNA